jgi:argininosuccinate lyase
MRKTVVGDVDAGVLRFTAGEDCALDAALIEADCIGTAAHVAALAAAPVRPPLLAAREARRVTAELVNIMRRARAGRFRIRIEDQDVHLAVERALTRRLGDLGRKVHAGRSRNDQVATDLRLYGRDQLIGVMGETASLARALAVMGRRNEMLPMAGRTHMRPAMPGSVGLWASAHAESLLDDAVALRAAYDVNDASPLGSAAGYGSPLELDRKRTARRLGFRRAHANVLYASNSRGKCEAAILSALAQVMLSLSRLAEDLVLYSAPEFGYFELPAGFCTGSSIMPQKSNPDVPELVRAKAARVLACAAAAASVVKSLPSGYHRDLQETKDPFLTGLRETRACLRVMLPLIRGLRPCRKALLAGFAPGVFAADRALELVLRGVPFRAAYRRVKADLAALEARDPREAVALRMRRGTARIDFADLRRRESALRRFAATERRRRDRAVSRLLGTEYPSLAGRARA